MTERDWPDLSKQEADVIPQWLLEAREINGGYYADAKFSKVLKIPFAALV